MINGRDHVVAVLVLVPDAVEKDVVPVGEPANSPNACLTRRLYLEQDRGVRLQRTWQIPRLLHSRPIESNGLIAVQQRSVFPFQLQDCMRSIYCKTAYSDLEESHTHSGQLLEEIPNLGRWDFTFHLRERNLQDVMFVHFVFPVFRDTIHTCEVALPAHFPCVRQIIVVL